MGSRAKPARPTVGTSFSDFQAATGPVQGQSVFGLTDISDLSGQLSKKGRKLAEEAGIDLENPFSLADLQAAGLGPKSLNKRARKDLVVGGLADRKGNRFAPAATIDAVSQGFTDTAFGPGTGQAVKDVFKQVQDNALNQITAGIDLQESGLALASGDTSSPLAQDILRTFNEQFGQQRAARGLGSSGQDAFQNTIGGLTSLAQFGQGQFALGQAAQQDSFLGLNTVNPFVLPNFNLGREDQRFNRNLGFFMNDQMQQALDRGEQSFSMENLFRSQLATGGSQALFNAVTNSGNHQNKPRGDQKDSPGSN